MNVGVSIKEPILMSLMNIYILYKSIIHVPLNNMVLFPLSLSEIGILFILPRNPVTYTKGVVKSVSNILKIGLVKLYFVSI